MKQPLADEFGLTAEQVSQEYDSKNAKIFLDRISWVLSYLNIADCVTKPKRGVYQINDEGRIWLSKPDKLKGYVRTRVQNRKPQDNIKRDRCRS